MNLLKRLFGGSRTRNSSNQTDPRQEKAAAPPFPPPKSVPAKPASPPTQARRETDMVRTSPLPKAASQPPPGPVEKEWQQFFDLVPLHESAQSFYKSFVGSWPVGVTPSLFAGDAYPTLVERLQAHITAPYPVASMRSGNNPPKPDYQMVNGKIARCSSPFIDMLICGVIPRHEMTSQEPHVIVWRLIEKHSCSALAKLLFPLPRMTEASKAAADGRTGVLVIEDVKIQVYKGIENVIFGAYEDLPEGGYLNDRIIDQKLRTLLALSPPLNGAIKVQIESFGIYQAKVTRVVPNPNAASGYSNENGAVSLVKQTDRIPLRKGLTFGVTVVPSGQAKGRPARLKYVWRFPPPGLKNPETGKTHLLDEIQSEFVFGESCVINYTFDAGFEMLPGKWGFEMWDGERELAEMTFIMETSKAQLLLEGTSFPLYSQEEPFFESCRASGQGALLIRFREFWEVSRRGSERKAIGGGIRLLCAKCLVDMPFSFQMSLAGGFGGSMMIFDDGLPENLAGSAKAATCPWCNSPEGVLLWDYAPLGDVTEQDLTALRELWRQRCLLWWRQNNRSEGICDDCGSHALARDRGYLKGSSVVCEACASKSTRSELLTELQKKPDYFGTSELRRARNLVSGQWHFEAGRIL